MRPVALSHRASRKIIQASAPSKIKQREKESDQSPVTFIHKLKSFMLITFRIGRKDKEEEATRMKKTRI